ncbi:MAG: hypothetical protein K9L78_01340 [Victivallales bacterium]|nr:hypothetical protein [Victivallales bacterium]MCF7888741.1 hypothetical protein [Victivallales bacterium]
MKKKIVEAGNTGDPAVLEKLFRCLKIDSVHVRRLSVSAIGKLAKFAKPEVAVGNLIPLLQDKHPQIRQYTIKALSAYGEFAKPALNDIKEIASSNIEKEYNIRDAEKAINVIKEACKVAEEKQVKICVKCGKKVEPDEFARSMKAFSRVYCDHCFDEVYIMRRNYDTKVELNKNIKTSDGTLVQSDGERIISDFLKHSDINYRYDERIRIIEGYAIRPDFYLPEFDIYIEYWGMDTIDYKIGMLKKRKLYQQQGKKLISVSFKDKGNLEKILLEKLSRYIKI